MKLTNFLACAAMATSFAAIAGPAGAASMLLGPDFQAETIFSKTYTTTGANSKVFGNVLAGGVSTTGANAAVTGNLVSVGAATTGGAGSAVTGNILSGGVLTTGDGSLIGGSVKSSGAGTIGANSKVAGSMITGGVATTGANSAVGTFLQAGGAASTGANSIVNGDTAAVGAISIGAGSVVGSQTALGASPVNSLALTATLEAIGTSFASQVSAAQTALSKMGAGTLLAPTITTDTTLFSGVYSAASLSTTAGTTLYLDAKGLNDQFWVFNIADILATGASTKVVLLNGGLNNSVIWNTGGYASLGASSTFIGTILAKTYISVGALAKVAGVGDACGGIYSATSYVSTGDTATVGGQGCSGTGDGFSVGDDGTAFHGAAVSATPEPGTWALLILGFGLVGAALRRRRTARFAASTALNYGRA